MKHSKIPERNRTIRELLKEEKERIIKTANIFKLSPRYVLRILFNKEKGL